MGRKSSGKTSVLPLAAPPKRVPSAVHGYNQAPRSQTPHVLGMCWADAGRPRSVLPSDGGERRPEWRRDGRARAGWRCPSRIGSQRWSEGACPDLQQRAKIGASCSVMPTRGLVRSTPVGPATPRRRHHRSQETGTTSSQDGRSAGTRSMKGCSPSGLTKPCSSCRARSPMRWAVQAYGGLGPERPSTVIDGGSGGLDTEGGFGGREGVGRQSARDGVTA